MGEEKKKFKRLTLWLFTNNEPQVFFRKKIKKASCSSTLLDYFSTTLHRQGFWLVCFIVTYSNLYAAGRLDDHITSRLGMVSRTKNENIIQQKIRYAIKGTSAYYFIDLARFTIPVTKQVFPQCMNCDFSWTGIETQV